ncbi:MAG: hypothetical protein AAB941_02075 [Patescibacteria group bacterium]
MSRIEQRKVAAMELRNKFIFDIVANHFLARHYSAIIEHTNPKEEYPLNMTRFAHMGDVLAHFNPLLNGLEFYNEGLEDLSVKRGEVAIHARWKYNHESGHGGMCIPEEYHFSQGIKVVYGKKRVYEETDSCWFMGGNSGRVDFVDDGWVKKGKLKDNLDVEIGCYIPGKWESTLPSMLKDSRASVSDMSNRLKKRMLECKRQFQAKKRQADRKSEKEKIAGYKERFGL